VPASAARPSSAIDEQAHIEALRAETHSGLIRAGRPQPPLDRESARALVDAGYMPLADYIAVYGGETDARTPDWSLSVSAHFSAPIPRRTAYRATSVHCSLPRQWNRPARRRA
jgi:hypothetical protein